MLRWIKATFFQLVFWWKKRTGWIDFEETIGVTGTVMSTHVASDGDVTFNVWPDDEFLWSITWYGGKVLTKLHCEVPPWISEDIRKAARSLTKGDRVRVTGQWGFDGVHSGRGYKDTWYRFIWEIILAVARHQPNVHEGWFEIHPVTKLEKL